VRVGFIVTGLAALAAGFAGGWVLGGGPAHAGLEHPTPDRAVQVLALPDWTERQPSLLRLLEGLDPQSARLLSPVFNSQDVELDECEVRPFVRAWADLDADAALAGVVGWRDDPRVRWGLEEIAHGRAVDGDVDAARDLVRTRAEGQRRDAAATGLVAGWAAVGDLDAAGAYVTEMPDGGRWDWPLDAFVRALMLRRGDQAATDWVDDLPDDVEASVVRNAFRLVLRFVTIGDPLVGKQWYEARSSLPRAAGARGILAAEWLEHDASAAATWLLSQPDDLESRQALSAGVQRWLELDPDAAEHWLQSHPDDPIAQAGVRPLVRHLAAERPLDAIAWIERLPDSNMRERNLVDVLRMWQLSDSESANAWIAKAELPRSVRRLIERGGATPNDAPEPDQG
jgi:hypothetical protein